MSNDHRKRLAGIRRFDQLVTYLRKELGWPIGSDDFDDITFDYTPDELGIAATNAARIQEIKRLRPLTVGQPWGIFFVKFEPKHLPVVALRRILGQFTRKRRASANAPDRDTWATDDLLFVSDYGEGDDRRISFAHFSESQTRHKLPTLKVLGWDDRDTALHLDEVATTLAAHLHWPDDEGDAEAWRELWRGAFTLRHREVIATSRQLSMRLAQLARAIRDRVSSTLDIETETGPLTGLMKAFREALLQDLTPLKFADMYAQTIAYGLLSARITNPKRGAGDDLAAHLWTNPFLQALMQTFLGTGEDRARSGQPGLDFDELGVSEVVELLDEAQMEAVVRDFGDRNPQEDPVIHFYEQFLAAYNSEQKVKRGVFYTPRPVVSFIVRSVHELLRTEYGLTDGLADTATWGEVSRRHQDLRIPDGVSPSQSFVQILDPATGTGTFLVEVIDLIHTTMRAKWQVEGYSERKIETLWNEYVPEHLLPRLHGYELLMAPYAIAHLKIGLKLFETGYRFDRHERARVFLTNALEPAGDEQPTLGFLPTLAHEVRAVHQVKRGQRFTVVIGNPPYSGVSANMGPWINGLLKGRLPDGTATENYYQADGEPLGERKVWLQDDYVKFIRLSQWLLDNTGAGVLGYITNHAYLNNLTFRGMRSSLMRSFRQIRVLDLHGNVNMKETSPTAGRDVNVFDIQQGVAIGLFAKTGTVEPVRRADLWGEREHKHRWLLGHDCLDTVWEGLEARPSLYLFEPFDDTETGEYYSWPTINELMPVNVTGIVTARDGFVTDSEQSPLLSRIETFLDDRLSDDEVRVHLNLRENYSWRVATARRQLRAGTEQGRLADFITRITYRPFDERLIFWHPAVVWRPRTEGMPHMLSRENVGLIFMRQVVIGGAYTHVGASRVPVDARAFYSNKGITSVAPLYLYPGIGKTDRSLMGGVE